MLTYSRVVELLTYEPETGLFRWNVNAGRWGRIKAGTVAGSAGNHGGGYVEINIDGTLYKAHRLAWLYMTGKMPENQVDHINCDRADNKWSNLRAATLRQNLTNKTAYKNNTSGSPGVTWHKRLNMWQARIGLNGKRRHIGYWEDKDAAAEAYKAAKAAANLWAQTA